MKDFITTNQLSIMDDDASSHVLERKTIDRTKTTTYKIISKDVREFHFIIPYNERVELGQIFSIRDYGVKDDEITFLARVTDIKHDSNYEGKWDTALKGTEFYDEDQIFNRIVAEPLGCIIFNEKINKKEFKKSKTIPSKFSEVEKASFDEFEFLTEKMGDLEVGYLRNGSQVVEEIGVKLNSEIMDHHMGVFATTGMGKSNFMKVFAASCMKKASMGESKLGLLLADPHGEYLLGSAKNNTKGLLHLGKYSDGLICYSTNKKNAEKNGEVEDLKIGLRDIKPTDILPLVGEWRTAQVEAIESLDSEITSDWLKSFKEDGKLVIKNFDPRTINVIERRLKRLLGFSYIDEKISSIDKIIKSLQEGKVVLIDMQGINEREELFLLSLLSRHILDKYREESLDECKKICLITIEEAQRVLGGKDSSISRFEIIAREGRKFGVGLCAITQQPKLVDKQLLSQFNTLVVMGLGDRNDRKCLEESAKQDLTTLDVEIQTLEKGEAIISTLKVPFPIPATIHLYEDYIEQLKKKDQTDGSPVSKAKKLSRPPD
ncbi:MAG: ATP-binding protein [Methanothrix sp.]|nr:ATP-binding protein [Methanothrix sp.]